MSHTPSQVRSITLDDFRGEFDPESFIDHLMQSGRDSSPEDLLEIFESCSTHIAALKKKAETQLEERTKQVAIADSEHKAVFSKIETDLTKTFEIFSVLEGRIESAGGKVKQIGEQLSATDKQAQRAAEAKQLIELYDIFSRNDVDAISSVPLLADPTMKHDAARTLRKLHDVGKDLKNDKALARIESSMESVEVNLLKDFDRTLTKRDLVAAKKCAETFIEYSGGDSVFSHFIGTRPMFLDPEIMLSDNELVQAAVTVEQCRDLTTNIFKQVLKMIEAEYVTVKAVFPGVVEVVMGLLVERVFAQRVHPVLSSLFAQIGAVSSAGVLVLVLCDTYKECLSFSQSVSTFETGEANIIGLINETYQYHSEELLHLELQSFSSLSSVNLPVLSKKQIKKGQEEGVFDMGLVSECIKFHAEAITRAKLLSPSHKLGYSISEMHSALREAVDQHLRSNLAHARLHLPPKISAHSTAKSPPEVLKVIGHSVRVMNAIQDHVTSTVIPNIADDSSTLSTVMLAQGEWEKTIEEYVSLALEEYVSTLISITHDDILSAGAKSFAILYKPREDSSELAEEPSPHVLRSIIYLNEHVGYLTQTLGPSSSNLEAVLTCLGKSLYSLLIAHIMKFIFNPAGGMQLLRDITAFKQHVAQYRSIAVEELFDLLRQVSSLFLVPPETLKTLIEDTAIHRLGHADLIQLVKQRADYTQAKIAKMLNMTD